MGHRKWSAGTVAYLRLSPTTPIKLSVKFLKMLLQLFQIGNFVRLKGMNHRKFKDFLSDMESEKRGSTS
jgi:hypothetical protein